jgi:hypothetical protein
MVRARHWHLDGDGCKYVCQDENCKLPHLSVFKTTCDSEEISKDRKRCKNCKHWQLDQVMATCDMIRNGVSPSVHPYGSCHRIKMEDEIGFVEFDPESVLDEEPAFVEDGSGYHAALRCGPEFGCILWEAKDENT